MTGAVPVDRTGVRGVGAGSDSDPDASLAGTGGEGGQGGAAGCDGRRRPALRHLNTEDGHWFNHDHVGVCQPDALTGPAGLANVVATGVAEASRRRDGAASQAPARTGP